MFTANGAQITAGSPTAIAFMKFWGWTDQELASMLPQYVALTPTDPRMAMGFTPFKAVHCRQFVSDEVLRASEMYRQVLRPGGVEYAMGITVPIQAGNELHAFGDAGTGSCPVYDGRLHDFGRFAPHITRAANMHGAFQRCREEFAVVKALLDGMPLGMMVVDDDELKVANRAARNLLGEGDAVRLQNGRLMAPLDAPMPNS